MATKRDAAPSPAPPQQPATAHELGDVLERVSDAVVALDREWRYTYVNRHAADLFDRRPEDLLGRHIWTLFPEGIGQPFQLAYERAMAEQVFIQIENYYEPWDRWFENRIYPSPDGLSIFFHEITDRKRAEQAAAKNAALLEGQSEILRCIARGEPLERTLDVLLRMCEEQCPDTLWAIELLQSDGWDAPPVVARSLPAPLVEALENDVLDLSRSDTGTVGVRGRATVADIATDRPWNEHHDLALEHGLRGSWSTPIVDSRSDLVGALLLYFRAERGPSQWEQRVVETAAGTAAIALANQNQAEARRASERRLQLAVTGGNVGIWELDVVAGRVLFSDQLKRMFGWPADTADFPLDRFIGTLHKDDRPRIERALSRSVEWGVDYDVEFRIVRPGGSVGWIAARGGGEYAASSTPVRIMGVALDITDRKQAENQLRQSDERFQLVARATNDAIWDWDLLTSTVWWNQGLTTLFGYSQDQDSADFEWRSAHIHPGDREQITAGIQSVTQKRGQFWSGEYRFRRSDGSYADVFDRGFLIYDAAGQPIRMIGAMTDVSDRKRAVERLEMAVATRTSELNAKNSELEAEIAERQRVAEMLRSRNEELKGFAYTVSHDLKAPLRGISGYAQELTRRHRAGLSDRGAFCLDQILVAARNLDRLIEDLLHYSRLDAETPTPGDVDIVQAVAAILRDCNGVIIDRHVEVTTAFDVERVRVWERGLMQVLANLIDNALKYSRTATPPRVHIASRAVPGGVQITVSDNGIGFDMKYHDRIFGLFNRLVRQEEFEGTGAGLAIVKKVVEKMGGSLRAQAAPGAGATFFVELPRAIERNA